MKPLRHCEVQVIVTVPVQVTLTVSADGDGVITPTHWILSNLVQVDSPSIGEVMEALTDQNRDNIGAQIETRLGVDEYLGALAKSKTKPARKVVGRK